MSTVTKQNQLSRTKISELSPADLLVELARRGINIEAARDVIKGKATCPHCNHEGPIEKDFGVRIMRGDVWPQSWCRTCRSTPEEPVKVHAKPPHRHSPHGSKRKLKVVG